MSKFKKKSIFRKAFLFPFAGISLLLSLYFIFFFEVHLKYLIEKSLFESLGSEVNIQKLDIKPFSEKISLKKIEFTDPDKPTQNIFEINLISLSYTTVKFLDLSFQSDEVKVTDIKFHTQRKRRGRVLDKDKRVLVFKDPSTHKISTSLKNNFKENSFLNLTKSLKGDLSKEELKEFSNKFESASFMNDLKKDRTNIDAEIDSFKKNLKSEKVKATLKELENFKFNSDSSAETAASVSKSLKLIKETEALKKELKSQIKSIKSNIKTVTEKAKKAPDTLTRDLNMVKSDFDRLDPTVLSEELFGSYFALQVSKIARVKSSMTNSALDEIKKQSSVDIRDHIDLTGETSLQEASEPKSDTSSKSEDQYSRSNLEKKRQKLISKNGRVFNFKKNPEPQFWIKKIIISSKASSGQDIGDVDGIITNVTSHPEIIKLPLKIDIKGSAPKQDIGLFSILGNINKINPNAQIQNFDIKVADYKVKDFKVLKDNGALLSYQESEAQTLVSLEQKGNDISLSLKQILKPTLSSYDAKDQVVKNILKEVSNLSPINLELKASGDINSPKIKLSTNIAEKLIDSVKRTGKNLAKTKVNDEVDKIKQDFLAKYLPSVDKNSNELNSESADLDSQVNLLFDEKIKKLKARAKSKKSEKIDKLKDKLLKKIKF